jgi:3-hydroxyisobutyrate dehydrogenase-like beta-hydroxyacid dehydrogenase
MVLSVMEISLGSVNRRIVGARDAGGVRGDLKFLQYTGLAFEIILRLQETTMTTRIGMVGIGLMGHGIARNLVKHGHALTVLEHAGNQPLDELRGMGVCSVSSLVELAKDSKIIILCVTGSPQVEAVLMGEGGLLSAVAKGTIIIDCSTAIPTSTQRVAQAVQVAGARFVDAPMTRTAKEAHEGRLNLLVGAEAALFDEVKPILQCFAENITRCGDTGSGHRMKLLHNSVSLGFIALLAEVAACAERESIDPQVFVEVLAKGGGASAALERLKPYLLARDSSGLQFAMSNAAKDLGYYTQMAGDADAARTIAQAVLQTYRAAASGAGDAAMVPELVSWLAKQ